MTYEGSESFKRRKQKELGQDQLSPKLVAKAVTSTPHKSKGHINIIAKDSNRSINKSYEISDIYIQEELMDKLKLAVASARSFDDNGFMHVHVA